MIPENLYHLISPSCCQISAWSLFLQPRLSKLLELLWQHEQHHNDQTNHKQFRKPCVWVPKTALIEKIFQKFNAIHKVIRVLNLENSGKQIRRLYLGISLLSIHFSSINGQFLLSFYFYHLIFVILCFYKPFVSSSYQITYRSPQNY